MWEKRVIIIETRFEMAKQAKSLMQKYPRMANSDLLDDTKLVPHKYKTPVEKLQEIIVSAIQTAERKSSRAILNLPYDASGEDVRATYKKEGWELFKYFIKYCSDPASTAHQCLNRKCSEVAKEQFRNRTLQKERMNSAWRYQYIAKDAASASKRFENVSDIGLKEADFNVVIRYKQSKSKLVIYVSVKNRSNTMGGQDWPKAISSLEREAQLDKNRDGDYICVFGMSMEKGLRTIRHNQKTGTPHSGNTEFWLSDYFWPFFSNYSYEEITKFVLQVLLSLKEGETSSAEEAPQELVVSFEECCKDYDLLDEQGRFKNAFHLVELFCRKIEKKIKLKTNI